MLPKWLGGRPNAFSAKFPSTGSLPDELHERNDDLRAPLRKRLKSILLKDGAAFHLAVSLMFVSGFLRNISRAYTLHPADMEGFLLYLLPRVFWVAATWPAYTAAYFRPFWYAVFPPTVHDREHLLYRDATGVAYPKDVSKLPKSPIRGFGLELVNSISAVWAMVLLFGSWWWVPGNHS